MANHRAENQTSRTGVVATRGILTAAAALAVVGGPAAGAALADESQDTASTATQQDAQGQAQDAQGQGQDAQDQGAKAQDEGKSQAKDEGKSESKDEGKQDQHKSADPLSGVLSGLHL